MIGYFYQAGNENYFLKTSESMLFLNIFQAKGTIVWFLGTELNNKILFNFWGTSEIALRIETYIAIIVFCLVVIVGYTLKIYCLSFKVLQVLSSSLVDKTPVKRIAKMLKN